MKTIKVSEATNVQLDWLVAKCEGLEVKNTTVLPTGKCVVLGDAHDGVSDVWIPEYTTDPAQMRPIIEREGISTVFQGDAHPWVASLWNYEDEDWHTHTEGPTALIAAARCYVISKLGETVEVPEELT